MMADRFQTRRRTSLSAALILATAGWLTVGCGDAPPAPPDPAQARQFLTATLDTWKAGGKPADLAGQTPPIQALERDWEAGSKLTAYQLEGEGHDLGANLQWPVSLTLKNSSGKVVKKRVVYVVAVSTVVSVARQDVDF